MFFPEKRKPKKVRIQKIEPWIKQRVSTYDYAYGEFDQKLGKLKPKYQSTKTQVLNHFNDRDHCRLSDLNNEILGRHLTWQTWYATGNNRGRWDKFRFSLFCIDVDCHRRGNSEGATAFLTHVEDLLGVKFFSEPSTNQTGIHAFAQLDKFGWKAESINSALFALEKFLRRVLKEGQLDGTPWNVSGVDVTGTLSIVTWVDGKAVDYQPGRFMKLPATYRHNGENREDELRNTALFTVEQLQGLPTFVVSQATSNKVESPDISGVSDTCDSEETQICTDLEEKGSFTGHVIRRREIERLTSQYLTTARRLMPEPLRTTGREVARAEDMAIFLMILATLTYKQGYDKAMPSKRIGENWKALFAEKLITRSYQPKIVAVLRNYLSDLGYIEWTDENYWSADKPGFSEKNLKGVACKYSLCNELMIAFGFREEQKVIEFSVRGITVVTSSINEQIEQDHVGGNTTVTGKIVSLPEKEPQPIIRPRRIGWATEYFGTAG